MKALHKILVKKSFVYGKWHRYRNHQFFHWLVFVAVALVLTVSIFSSSANYDPQEDNNMVGFRHNKADSIQLTNKLLQEISQYEDASDADKQTILSNLVLTVEVRKQAMLLEASNDPTGFLSSVLPPGLEKKVPSEVSDLFERETEIQGKLTVFYIDNSVDESKDGLVYKIEDETTGKNYNVHTVKVDPTLKTGSVVKIDGYRLDQEIVTVDSATLSGLTILETPTFSTTGDQHTLVMLVNFTNNSTPQTWTPAQVAATLFTNPDSVDAYYKDSSFNLTGFTGDVTNWLNIPYTNANCNTMFNSTWTVATNTTATASGYVLGNYRHLVYVFSGLMLNDCGFAGYSSVGGDPSLSWVIGLNGGLVRHELGHAIGMTHSSTIDCGVKAIDTYSSCLNFDDRGDLYDVMGSTNGNYYDAVGTVGSGYTQNGAHKVQQAWIPSARVQTVTTNGIYTIAPLEVLSVKPQVLKILKSDSSSSSGYSYYYLDYRQPLGFDQTLPVGITSGVGVVVWPANVNEGSSSANTLRLDTTPGDNDWSNSALSDGRVFTDVINGVTITQISHTSAEATVQVTFSPGVCARSLPTITTPNINQQGWTGQTLTYNVSVGNHDSLSCPSSTFATSIVGLPVGFTALVNPSMSTIAPGSTASIAVAVTSPLNSINSLNPFTITAVDVLDGSRTTSAQTSYSVIGNGPTLPVVTITSPIDGSVLLNTKKGGLSIVAKANDLSGIAKIELYMDNKLVKSCTRKPTSCSTSISLGNITTGSHVIVAKAYNTIGKVGSAQVAVKK